MGAVHTAFHVDYGAVLFLCRRRGACTVWFPQIGLWKGGLERYRGFMHQHRSYVYIFPDSALHVTRKTFRDLTIARGPQNRVR